MIPVIDTARSIIKNDDNIVVISGENVMRETGLNGLIAEHIAYDIEERYGYSNDEIMSSLFYARRVETFYDYYRNIVLNIENPMPTAVHRSIAKMQRQGKVDAIITDMVYCLYQMAGAEDVIELHGSVEENRCPVCGELYGSDYIRNAHGIPQCSHCQVPLRPGFSLLGEMLDNGKMTQATHAVGQATDLLILGTSLNSKLCRHLLKYFSGNKVILINTHEMVGDEQADYCIYGNIGKIFMQMVGERPNILMAQK